MAGEEKSKYYGFSFIVGLSIAIVVLLVGGGLALKLWSILSSFRGNTLMILVMGITVLFFWLILRKRKW